MKQSFALKNAARAFLLAGLTYGVSGAVQAQFGGPGSVGGLGQQGAPAGEFPGEGSALDQFRTPPQQEGVTTVEPPNPPPRQNTPGKRAPSMDPSGAAGSAQPGQPPSMGPVDPAQPAMLPAPDLSGPSPGSDGY